MKPFRIIAVVACAVLMATALTGSRAPHLKKLSRKQIENRCDQLSTTVRREVAGLQYLLRPEELAALLSEPEDHRCQDWIDGWWNGRDPIYTTPNNEAREEHEKRVAAATEYFGRGAWPGWDDRGEVFIRYGAPGSYSHIPADVAEPGVYIPAQDYWYYPQFDMYARFADPTGAGRYFFFLEGVQMPVGERPRSDRRTMASKYLADRPMDYMQVDVTTFGFEGLVPPFPEKGYDDFMKRVYRYYDVVEKTPAVHSFDYAFMRVPMCFAVQSFRGGDGVDRVDVNTEFESSVMPLRGDSYSRRFMTTAVFWDARGREIARYARMDSVRTWSLVEDSTVTVLNQSSFTLPPGAYRMAVTVQESESGRFTSLRRDVHCGDMEARPAMSDLALARSIGPARDGSPFNRGALVVVPRPSATYRTGAPVPLYFELYHLEPDANGAYSYRVDYTITPGTPRPRSLWKRLTGGDDDLLLVRTGFDAAAAGPDDIVHVLASTENLWPGRYTLAVTVTDAAGRSVSRSESFTLRESP